MTAGHLTHVDTAHAFLALGDAATKLWNGLSEKQRHYENVCSAHDNLISYGRAALSTPTKAPDSGAQPEAIESRGTIVENLAFDLKQRNQHIAELESEVQRWETAGEALEEAAKAKVDAALKRVAELDAELAYSKKLQVALQVDRNRHEDAARTAKDDARTARDRAEKAEATITAQAADAKVEVLQEAYDRLSADGPDSLNARKIINDMISELTPSDPAPGRGGEK